MSGSLSTGDRARAWVVTGLRKPDERLALVERTLPPLADHEIRVQVHVCGVCRTDLHLAAGELPARRPSVAPGHEVVGRVTERGAAVTEVGLGERVGVAWLRSTCGTCRWCRHGAENLCPASTYTGWDQDGGYAEYTTVPAAYAYRIPESYTDQEAAPLLCAGIIGYRALRRARVPVGGRLGIYGFGASAHLTAQIALAQGTEVHVLTRGREAQELALALGAASAGDAYAQPPCLLDSAIVFAPVGDLVPVALEALDSAGTLAVAGIHLSDIPSLDYQRHLFRERTLTSVTANTRADGDDLLRLAAAFDVKPHVSGYSFDEAPQALRDLEAGLVTGAAVLRMPAADTGAPR